MRIATLFPPFRIAFALLASVALAAQPSRTSNFRIGTTEISIQFFNGASHGDFVGSYAVVHFSARAKKLRERVRLIDQADYLPDRPVFEKTVELKDGVGSDIQLFGYHGQRTKDTAWRFFRQDLFLDDDTTPFLILHWRHTVDEIKLIDVIRVK